MLCVPQVKDVRSNGVIAILGDFERSNEYNVTNVNIVESLVVPKELVTIQKSVDTQQPPSSKRVATKSSFRSAKETKKVHFHLEDLSKMS